MCSQADGSLRFRITSRGQEGYAAGRCANEYVIDRLRAYSLCDIGVNGDVVERSKPDTSGSHSIEG